MQILQRTWSERRKTITCNMPLFSVWFLCRCVPCSSLSFLVHPLGLTPCYTSNLNMNLILIVLTLKWRHKATLYYQVLIHNQEGNSIKSRFYNSLKVLLYCFYCIASVKTSFSERQGTCNLKSPINNLQRWQ